MNQIPKNPEAEAFIHEEILVDAYGDEEIAMCWEQFLNDALGSPFEGLGASDPKMEGERYTRMTILGLHPKAEVGIRNVLLLARLPKEDWHFAIRPEDLQFPEGWEFDPDWEERDEPDPWQALYLWCYWKQHLCR